MSYPEHRASSGSPSPANGPAGPAAGGDRPGDQPGIDPNTQIQIKIADGQGSDTIFKIRSSTKLGKVISTWCDRQGKDPHTMRFLFDGQRVVDGDTPASLEMVDGDIMEVHQEQVGGDALLPM